MVRITVATLTSALLLAAVSPLAKALPFNGNSTEVVARDQLEARYDPIIETESLDRRYLSSLSGPSGYRFSWVSTASASLTALNQVNILVVPPIAGANSVGQSEVNACANICERTQKCGFFHPVQMKGNSEGNVICALYTVKQDKSAATFTTGPGSTGGSVVSSYGFTRNDGPVGASNLPTPPTGASLVQYKGCSTSSATVPMFVNKNYPITGSTSASTVWIVQHGSGRNFNDYFSSLYNVVGDQGVIIAPQFYASSDSGRWYQPGVNLAWNSNDWFNGAEPFHLLVSRPAHRWTFTTTFSNL